MKDKMLNGIRKIRTQDYCNTKNLPTNEVIKYYREKAKLFDKLLKELKPLPRRKTV